MYCEMCHKKGSLRWYCIDNNMEVQIHPRCARALAKVAEVEVIK